MTTPKTVVVTGTSVVPDATCDEIEGRGYEVRRIRRDQFSSDDLHKALDGASGYLIGGYDEALDEHFDEHPELEAVAWVGTDYQANVPGWRRAYETGVAFINAPGANAVSVAEFTMLLALTMSRPFTANIATPSSAGGGLPTPGNELRGRRLGIIGPGRIGARVARIAKYGFGMDIVYTAPRGSRVLEHALDVEFVGKAELLATCDLVSLHRPGLYGDEAPELGRPEFEAMRPATVLVNSVHHRLVDPDALLWAIEAKDVRAAFDGLGAGTTWDRLVGLGPQRFVAVPAMSFHTVESNARASELTATAVCDVLDGGTSAAVNNPDFRAVRARRDGRATD